MCVCLIKNYSLPRAVEGAIFPSGEERSMLNKGTAQHQLLLLCPAQADLFLKLRSQF